MEIRSATEECEDDSTEPLRYYDYGEEMSVDEESSWLPLKILPFVVTSLLTTANN